jgi:hypothetical protein
MSMSEPFEPNVHADSGIGGEEPDLTEAEQHLGEGQPDR